MLMEELKYYLNKYYTENKLELELLNSEEINKMTSAGFFSINPFSEKKHEVRSLIQNETIVFGFEWGGICCYDRFRIFSFNKYIEIDYSEFYGLTIVGNKLLLRNNIILTLGPKYSKKNILISRQLEFLKQKLKFVHEEQLRLEKEELENKLRLEKEELEKTHSELVLNQKNALSVLDKDGNGEIDLVENDFNKLLSKYQKRVMEIDKNYIHQFVKISNFIKTKKQNTQKIFESIRDTSSQEELEERVKLLKNQIHAYELLVFHSINMIGALVSEELITFYEIHESFDKLGMFNSNWENEVSEKLTNIGDKLDELMYSIYNMEQNIVNELSHLSYVTQESFEDLNRSVTGQLSSIDSSIKFNNLLTGIQAYQMYKINRNTKGLDS
jgi:hypothetical protein